MQLTIHPSEAAAKRLRELAAFFQAVPPPGDLLHNGCNHAANITRQANDPLQVCDDAFCVPSNDVSAKLPGHIRKHSDAIHLERKAAGTLNAREVLDEVSACYF
jgi:hypothetical protein